MKNRKDIIGDRKPTRLDWWALADNWGVNSDYTLTAVKPKGVACGLCWDWDLCAECLGEYPDLCPMDCKDGTCYDHKKALRTGYFITVCWGKRGNGTVVYIVGIDDKTGWYYRKHYHPSKKMILSVRKWYLKFTRWVK